MQMTQASAHEMHLSQRHSQNTKSGKLNWECLREIHLFFKTTRIDVQVFARQNKRLGQHVQHTTVALRLSKQTGTRGSSLRFFFSLQIIYDADLVQTCRHSVFQGENPVIPKKKDIAARTYICRHCLSSADSCTVENLAGIDTCFSLAWESTVLRRTHSAIELNILRLR